MESYCLSHQVKLIDVYSLSYLLQVMFNVILLQNSLSEAKGKVIFYFINVFRLNISYKLIVIFILIKFMTVFKGNFLSYFTYISVMKLPTEKLNYTIKK